MLLRPSLMVSLFATSAIAVLRLVAGDTQQPVLAFFSSSASRPYSSLSGGSHRVHRPRPRLLRRSYSEGLLVGGHARRRRILKDYHRCGASSSDDDDEVIIDKDFINSVLLPLAVPLEELAAYPSSSSPTTTARATRASSILSTTTSTTTSGNVEEQEGDNLNVGRLAIAWALSYANLQPETPSTPAGLLFLATNLSYALAGIAILFLGNGSSMMVGSSSSSSSALQPLGLFLELAATASFTYHYAQLELGTKQPPLVRLALLIDYVVAFAAIGIGLETVIVSSSSGSLSPADSVISFCGQHMEIVVASVAALVAFALSWVREGYSYLFFHGVWHLLGAYSGYLLGIATTTTTTTTIL